MSAQLPPMPHGYMQPGTAAIRYPDSITEYGLSDRAANLIEAGLKVQGYHVTGGANGITDSTTEYARDPEGVEAEFEVIRYKAPAAFYAQATWAWEQGH